MSPSAEQWGRDFERRPGWTALKAALAVTAIVLVIVAVVGLATTGSVFFRGEAAKRTVGERTNTRVYSPENKIAQIAFFHDTCQAVNRQLRVVANNQARYDADLRAAHYARDPVRRQQAEDALQQDATDVTGAKNALAATVADYNSRSAQSTANVFKGSGLPDRIVLSDPLPAEPYQINCG